MRSVIVLSLLTTFLVSCNNDHIVASGSSNLPEYWNKNETMEFKLPEMDTTKSYNVFIHLRNTNEYKFNNLFLIVSMKFPHGKTITDTLEYRMANPDGSWLGEGIGSVKENKLWYKENVSFPEKGAYLLRIAQAVRNNGNVDGVTNLEGVTDVGYSIEEAPQQ